MGANLNDITRLIATINVLEEVNDTHLTLIATTQYISASI